MNNRLMKYSIVATLILAVALPALAFSQYGPRRGPEAGATFGNGESPGGPGVGPAELGQRGAQRFAARELGRQGRRDGLRDRGRAGGRPGFGRRAGRRGPDRRAGLARGIGRDGRAGLATRALGRAEDIGLSSEQREQILAARRGSQESSINRRAASQIAGLELRELMQADSPDLAAVEAKLRELSDHRIAEQTGNLRLDAAVGEILTAEQLEALQRRPPNERRRPGRANR